MTPGSETPTTLFRLIGYERKTLFRLKKQAKNTDYKTSEQGNVYSLYPKLSVFFSVPTRFKEIRTTFVSLNKFIKKLDSKIFPMIPIIYHKYQYFLIYILLKLFLGK